MTKQQTQYYLTRSLMVLAGTLLKKAHEAEITKDDINMKKYRDEVRDLSFLIQCVKNGDIEVKR